MSRILICSLQAVAAILAFNVAACVHAANPPNPPNPLALERVGLQVNWTGQAVLDPSRDKISFITNDEDLLYVQSSAGVVTALNAEVGRRMWVRQVGRNDAYSMRAVSNSDLVLIVSGPEAFGLDKFTGEERFRYRLKRQPSSAPAINDKAVYFPLSNGSVYGYSLTTLSYLTHYGTLPQGVTQPYLWRFVSNERTEQPPVTTEDVVAFGTTSNNLHSVSAAGVSYYQEFLNAAPSAPLALDLQSERSAVIIATEDGNLFSFDLTRGTLAWNVPLERRVSRQPLIVGDRVFLVMNNAGVAGVSTRTGNYVQVENEIGSTDRWYVPGINSLVGVAGKYVYGVDRNRRIVAMDQDTATVIGRTSMNGYDLHHQNSATDRLFLSSDAGELICLKPLGSDDPTYHQCPDREPISIDVPVNDEAEAPDAAADQNPPGPE
jgi:outer membrane protein assembly factor BamB